MAKVVTSQGLQDFVSTGKPTETIANDSTSRKAALATKLAAVDSPAIEPPKPSSEAQKEPEKAGEQKSEAKPETNDDGLEAEDHDLAERAKRRIGKKHYEMKKAQEEAAAAREESESDRRLAETLFNERELWKKRAEEAEKRTPKAEEPKSTPLVEPDPQKYYDDRGQFKAFEYAKDLAEYSAKKAVEDERKAQKEENDKRAKEASDAAVRAKIEEATKKYPDWEKLVTGSDIQLQHSCLQFIAESEYGMDIAYFLAKTPKEAERIRKLSPLLAVAELGKLQTQFEKAAAPPADPAPAPKVVPEVKGAPAPITPISTSGSGTVQLDPAKMSFKELRAYERERARNRR